MNIDRNAAIFVLWGVAALVLAWTWIPALISALGGTRFLTGLAPDLEGADRAKREPDYEFWSSQILALGYEPLGFAWTRINFAGPEWVLFSPLRIFVHPQKQCFAIMQKAPAPFWFWPGSLFATVWSDGTMLISDNNLAAEPNPEDELIRQGIVTLKLADLEMVHLATTEVLRRNGRKPEGELTIDTLLHALQTHFGAEARRTHGRAGTQYLFAHSLIHICLSTPAAYVAGIGHWSVPLVNLILALIMLYGESSQKRQYAAAVRYAFRQKQVGWDDDMRKEE
jgi:hypothetical protein